MEKLVIQLDKISKSFILNNTKNEILKDISFLFHQNNNYALTGVSGTGKSTLIHIIAGLEKPSAGKIFYNNNDINNIEPKEKSQFLQEQVGLIFQSPYLIDELTVLENIMIKGMIGYQSKSELENQAFALLQKINLLSKALLSPKVLSGGEQQRIAIARALCNKPKFLIADEPTAHLDENNKLLILDLLLEFQKEWNMGLIIASHDPYICNSMQNKIRLSNQNLVLY